MYSILIGTLFFAAVNAAVMPAGDLRPAMFMSERRDDGFAYTIEGRDGIVRHSQGIMMDKPLTYAKAYPGYLSMLDSRSYPGMPGMIPLSGMSHLYGGAYPLAPQPITYAAGQHLLMGHQPLLSDVTKQQVIIPQMKI